MSDYYDLFLKAQTNTDAPYMAFVFDGKNSKLLDDVSRAKMQFSMVETMNMITKKLKLLEKKINKKILINERHIQVCDDVLTHNNSLFKYYNNPCILSGDSYLFYVYNNTISQNDFLKLFYMCAQKCENIFDYHFASCKFETIDYKDGNKLFYIGYVCPCLLQDKNVTKEFCIDVNANEFKQ